MIQKGRHNSLDRDYGDRQTKLREHAMIGHDRGHSADQSAVQKKPWNDPRNQPDHVRVVPARGAHSESHCKHEPIDENLQHRIEKIPDRSENCPLVGHLVLVSRQSGHTFSVAVYLAGYRAYGLKHEAVFLSLLDFTGCKLLPA